MKIGGGYGAAGVTVTDAGFLSMNSNLVVGGTASVVGASTLAGTASITGASSLAGTVKIGGGYAANSGTGVTVTDGAAWQSHAMACHAMASHVMPCHAMTCRALSEDCTSCTDFHAVPPTGIPHGIPHRSQ